MPTSAAAEQDLRVRMDSTLTAVIELWLLATGKVPWSYERRSDAFDQLYSYVEEMNDAIPKKDFSSPKAEVGRSSDQPVSGIHHDIDRAPGDMPHAGRIPLPVGRRGGPGRGPQNGSPGV